MQRVILHGHIFKNAGTTLDWSFARSFGEGFLDHRQDQVMIQHGGAHLRDILRASPQLSVISSHHMPRDLPNIENLQFQPLYLLRHPLLRLRSAYRFERQQDADTPGAQAAREKDFANYVRWRMQHDVSRTIRNYQTVYLAGFHRRASNALLALKCFSDAIETFKAVPLIGLVEDYDTSMVVFESVLKQDFPELDLAYVAQNVTQPTRVAADTDQEVASVLAELGDLAKTVIDENSYDLALYQLVKARLGSQTAAIADFSDRLAAFNQRCDALRPVMPRVGQLLKKS
ncbi:MAG: hypothetical protein CR978_02040 [Gammaproteobacteria bacterium]|nr:MAG: hypothetical protein CR978_02040 [Gammaproteobacteria bacterium]